MKLLLLHIAYLFLCCFVTFTNPSATGEVSINCGSIGTSAARDGREWVGDGDVINHKPKSPPCSLRGSSTTSTVNHRDSVSADPVPHGTARISRSQFSYAVEVGPGQKLIRLHFHSAPYRGFIGLRDLFTVEAGPFTLLSNFSASLAAYVLGANSFSKDFCLSVQENQLLNITFSPEASSSKSLETYAFINGIEIISVPAGLSYIQGGGEIGVQVLGQESQVFVDHHTALELIHRQNTKRAFLMTGVYLDELGKAESVNNETWRIPVDVGFRYMIRLHLSRSGDVVFRVLINEMIALTNFDVVEEKRVGNKILWYKDSVVVMMRGHKMEGRRDLLISLESYDETIDGHGFLVGFEVFKLSNPDNRLASPNPLPETVEVLFACLCRRNAVSLVIVTIVSLVCIIVHTCRGYWEANCRKEENKPSERAERLCRRFSLAEIQLATRDFSDGLLIGRGGFGKVYKGFIDRGQTTVAVKRLKSNSMQGAHEFLMEIETLSELRHFNLVSLIGYCNEQREMILVYDYMSGGTLSDCLYKLQCENSDSSSLTWKQRLNTCIGAGRGLDYLHTGHGVIHRDVKTSNILLDENLVAKVSDFGLAKHEDRGKIQSHISTRVKGTRGYLDPHYLHTRKLTRKTDTYAFGVVLFEVLCGRRAVDLSLVDDEHILTIWAREKISKGEVDEIVDLSLKGEISLASLKTFVGIAEKCLRDEPKNRPTMAQVVQQLDFAFEQQDNEQVLVSNEITSASDDSHPSNEDFDVPRNSEQPTMASTHEQGLTPLLEEQANSQLVNTGVSSRGKDGRKDTIRKPSRLWPWDAFWSRVKPSKKNDLSSETNARVAEIWDETSIRSTMFDWEMIAASTNQFSIDHQLGQSRFSSVYKGVLPTGQEVAVKRRSSSSKHGFQKFKNETRLLPNLLHQNIIKLLGYCIRGDKLLTVYEFIGNQSLDTFITGQQHFLLQWDVRFKIIMGIARGVVYLHQDSGRRVIHQNLNTSNILLDLEMNPKISYFCTARALADDHFELETQPAGTNQACWSPTLSSRGYISPECLALGKFSVKSDVYSFGVIILEIVSGQKSIRPSGSEPMFLKDYACELWNEDRAGDLVDESLGGAFPQEEALRFIHVGLLCTQWEPNNRPTMPSVLKMLEGNELLVELQHGGSSAVSSTSKSSTATGSRAKGGVPHSVIHSAQKTTVQDPLNPKSNRNSGPDSFEALPSFRDVPNSEKQNLFVRKLNLCCVVFDFTDPLQDLKEKEIKRQTLLELIDYIVSANGKFSELVIQETVRMVSANLFRTQFTQRRENKAVDGFDVEEEEPLLDPTWPHLQLVYEFLLRFVASPETEPKRAKSHLDHRFVLRLLDLFDSEDPREREYLKTVLHRIYGRFMSHRPFIRKSLNNIFYHFIFETEKHNGIGEILEIMGSIINGLSLPLKEEHELFFVRVLIPLHRPKCLPMYHQQLTYCITQFLEKDYKLSGTILRGLLKYWPITNSSKEVLFLGELEEVLEATHPPEFQRCMVPLFQQISRCLSSSHFQVAEKALFLWNNERVEKMIKQNLKTILPIILPALERDSRSHWNQAVRNLTLNVRKFFSDADPELFEECLLKFQYDEAHEEEIKKKREAMWRRMEEIAATNEAMSRAGS